MKDLMIKTAGIMVMAIVLMAAASKNGTRGTAAAQSVGNPMLVAVVR